jgi:hypothetical protein
MWKPPCPLGANIRFRALLLLLTSISCWTDEVVLLLVPSLSQECFDSTEDDEAIVARSANQQPGASQAVSSEKPCAVLGTICKQFNSIQRLGQNEPLARPGGLYQLMSLQL